MNLPCRLLTLFLLLTRSKGSQKDFETFKEMVKINITKARNFIETKDNSNSLKLENYEINDFGTFDFIIIGAGSAGTVLANRLSERKYWKILLLEAGDEESDFTDIPGMAKFLQNTKYNWGYYTVPQNTTCLSYPGKQCPYLRGKGLGGSSIINYMAYVRGNKQDYDSWGAVSNEEWNYKKVLPYFKKSERFQTGGDSRFHGKSGELTVNHTSPKSIFSETFLKSMEEMNVPYIDYNGKNQKGFSRMQNTINFNKRASGGRSFIDPIRHRKNLIISLNSFVTQVQFDKNKAKGVLFIHKGKLFQAKARKEIILSAGSLNTPQILMWSGVGPKKDLKEHKINPIKESENVGKNLKCHPIIFFSISTNITEMVDFEEALKLYHDSAFRPFNDALNIDYIKFLSLKGSSRPDLEFMFTSDLNGANFYDENFKSIPKNKFSIIIMLLHPISLGEVSLKSKDPKDFPLIDMNFFMDPEGEDRYKMYRGIRHVQEILNTESMKAINATLQIQLNHCDGLDYDSKEYWYCLMPYLTEVGSHPQGTTKMGLTDKDSVVDSQLKVHGLQNLRIVDAGIFPNTISGHLNAPVYMIAERISDIIKQTYAYN